MKNKKPSVFSFSILFLSFPVGCLQSRQQSDKQTIPQKEKKDESFSDFSPPFSVWFNGPIRALYGRLILKSDWTGQVCLWKHPTASCLRFTLQLATNQRSPDCRPRPSLLSPADLNVKLHCVQGVGRNKKHDCSLFCAGFGFQEQKLEAPEREDTIDPSSAVFVVNIGNLIFHLWLANYGGVEQVGPASSASWEQKSSHKKFPLAESAASIFGGGAC